MSTANSFMFWTYFCQVLEYSFSYYFHLLIFNLFPPAFGSPTHPALISFPWSGEKWWEEWLSRRCLKLLLLREQHHVNLITILLLARECKISSQMTGILIVPWSLLSLPKRTSWHLSIDVGFGPVASFVSLLSRSFRGKVWCATYSVLSVRRLPQGGLFLGSLE